MQKPLQKGLLAHIRKYPEHPKSVREAKTVIPKNLDFLVGQNYRSLMNLGAMGILRFLSASSIFRKTHPSCCLL